MVKVFQAALWATLVVFTGAFQTHVVTTPRRTFFHGDAARRVEVSMSASSQVKGSVTAPEVIPPDYKLPAAFFLGGLGLCANDNLGAGIPVALIGAFLAARAQKVRFVFDKDSMEVMTVNDEGKLGDSGENFAVGGQNRWKYNTFVDWQFLPSPALPILVYFKETQTRPEGQIHFFPIIMDGPKLYQIMKERIPLPGK